MCKNLFRKAQQNKKEKSNSFKELLVSNMTEVANISEGQIVRALMQKGNTD